MNGSDPTPTEPMQATKNRILEFFQEDPSPKTKLHIQCLLFTCRHADHKLLHFSVQERDLIKSKAYAEAAQLLQQVLEEAKAVQQEQNRNKVRHRKHPKTTGPSPMQRKKLRRIEELTPVRMEPIEPDRIVRKNRLRGTPWTAPFIGPEINRVVNELVQHHNDVQRQAIIELARLPFIPSSVQLAMQVQEMIRQVSLHPFNMEQAIENLFEDEEVVVEDPLKQVKQELEHWQREMDEAVKAFPRSVWVKLPTESRYQEQHGREVENRRRQTYRAIDRLLEEGRLKAFTREGKVWLEALPEEH